MLIFLKVLIFNTKCAKTLISAVAEISGFIYFINELIPVSDNITVIRLIV